MLFDVPAVVEKLKRKQTMSTQFVKVEKKKIKKVFAIKLITAISENLWLKLGAIQQVKKPEI